MAFLIADSTGAGAVIGALLAATENSITYLDGPSRPFALDFDPLKVTSALGGAEAYVDHLEAVEVRRSFEFVVVEAQHLRRMATDLSRAVGHSTTVLVLSPGLEHVEEIRKACHGATVLDGQHSIGAFLDDGGVVRGTHRHGTSDRAERNRGDRRVHGSDAARRAGRQRCDAHSRCCGDGAHGPEGGEGAESPADRSDAWEADGSRLQARSLVRRCRNEAQERRRSMNRWPPILTSCWSTRLPPEFCRIGISRGPPRGQKGYRRCMQLAPGPWMRSVGDEEFMALYRLQLSQLDPRHVADELTRLSRQKPIALLCFERPGRGAWCHRALAARWLSDGLGQAVPEFGFEHVSVCQHPLTVALDHLGFPLH